MKRHLVRFPALASAAISLAATLAVSPAANPAKANTEAPPNVIVIFTDDQGYGDLGCFGSKTIATPNLDRLAAEGRRFTDFHVASSVCTPSRAALLTGCYPKRVGLHRHVLFPPSKIGLNPTERSIARHLKASGYATAAIGKWHLGHFPETLPRSHGFDSYFGIPYSNDMKHPDNKAKPGGSLDQQWLEPGKSINHWNTPLVENEAIVELPVDQRTITRRYTDRAIAFVTANRERPFFLYLAHSMPHIPLFVPDEVRDPNPENAYRCVIEHLDRETGRLFDTIRQLKIERRTIILFTTDNGPWLVMKNHGGSAGPLRNGKGTPFEGGQRVPCILWAPGRVPAGTTSNAPWSSLDVFPTLAAMTGFPLPDGPAIDGLDLTATVSGDAPSKRDEFVYYTAQGEPAGIRKGDWKLLVRYPEGNQKAGADSQPALLFNLAEDLAETTNLADRHKDKVEELRKLLEQRDAAITAGARPVWQASGPHPWPDKPQL